MKGAGVREFDGPVEVVVASKPAGVPWEVAVAFPVPALTAEQVLDEALKILEGSAHRDGGQLAALAILLDDGRLSPSPVASFVIEQAAAGLPRVVDGASRGAAVVSQT